MNVHYHLRSDASLLEIFLDLERGEHSLTLERSSRLRVFFEWSADRKRGCGRMERTSDRYLCSGYRRFHAGSGQRILSLYGLAKAVCRSAENTAPPFLRRKPRDDPRWVCSFVGAAQRRGNERSITRGNGELLFCRENYAGC